MFYLQFTSCIAFMIFIYCLLAEILKISDYSAEKNVRKNLKKKKKNSSLREDIIWKLALKLSRFIPLDADYKKELEINLKSANMEMSAEVYVARALVKSILTALLAIPIFMIMPLIAPMMIILAVALYFQEMQKAGNIARENKLQIERELPRFVNIAAENLKSSRDVLSLLENYKKSAGDAFKNELTITIADMRTGNHETALKRLETRIVSPQLSEVIRGLISVLRGDDSLVYFEMLSHDFKQLELQRLKKIALKRPQKIKKYTMSLVLSFLMTYIVVLGLVLKEGIQVFK